MLFPAYCAAKNTSKEMNNKNDRYFPNPFFFFLEMKFSTMYGGKYINL